jgi:hypothetical protein
MKNSKTVASFAAGFLPGCVLYGCLALLLSACFNPITAIPPKQNDRNIDPFTVDILIGKDPADDRSIAGPDADRIKGDIRNFVQLIVVNNKGAIVAFDEIRREKNSDNRAVLKVDSLPFGHTYYFLLLMGRWDRNHAAETGDGTYKYASGPPTLLAAGLKEQLVTGSGTITVTIWPVVVDTVFSSGTQTTDPVVNTGIPKAVTLFPGAWNVTWTIKRGLTGNGLTDLILAQNIASNKGDALALKSAQTIVREGTGAGTWTNAVLNGNTLTRSLAGYTEGFGRIGGSANFKLEYVPFNLTAGEKANPWTAFDGDSVFNLSGKQEPVWIIRNGLNDLAQDGNTDFNNLGNGTANGNGAVCFGIEPKTPYNGSALTIRDGEFTAGTGADGKIGFTTGGYTGNAEVYYAVVSHRKDPPGYSEYKLLNGSAGTGRHQETVSLTEAGGNYDIYTLVYKAGEVSNPLVINTAGEQTGTWQWGEEPAVYYYIKSNGDDNATGEKTAPLATVQKALEKIAATCAANTWPEEGPGQKGPGVIVILDTVTVADQITINNTGSIYPPIILTDEPKTPGGKLQAKKSIGSGNFLLRIEGGAKVTLDGGLNLAGTNAPTDNIRGISVTGSSVFTLKGGQISGYSSWSTFAYGGGVYVSGGTFSMTGGEISGNSAHGQNHCYGGGVYVSNGTFTMAGGKISGNSDISDNSALGGGVSISVGTFTMTGGEISGNSVDGQKNCKGGGVFISGGISTMTGGKISNNSVTNAISSSPGYGGGAFISGGTFTMTGGKISGNILSSRGGNAAGVYLNGTVFILNGGEISGNAGTKDDFIQGGGVYVHSGTFFTMIAGKVSGNTLPCGNGGGVYLNGGTLNLTGGEISGNTVAGNGDGGRGGGVCSHAGTFSMTGGEISGNTAGDNSFPSGGGVYLGSFSIKFTKTGGIIYGYDSLDPVKSNKATYYDKISDKRGHAIYVDCGTDYKYYKDATVGSTDNLTADSSAGDFSGW